MRPQSACLEDNGCWWAGEPVLPGAETGAVEEVTPMVPKSLRKINQGAGF